MSTLLKGKIRKAIAKGFKGKLLKGTLTRRNSSTVDPNTGFPTNTTPQSFTVEGFHDNYNETFRVGAGIPETDSQIILIAGNCQIEPKKDDKIIFPNYPSFQIRKIKTDPDKAHFDCQVYEIK